MGRLLCLTLLALMSGLAMGEAPLSPREIASLALPSVVMVICQDELGEDSSFGSGSFVSPRQVATNHHVVEDCAKVIVRAVNQEERHEPSLARYDAANDVAVLSFDEDIGTPLPLDESTPVHIGEEIFAVGNPEGFEGTFSRGLISAIRRDPEHQLQITAPISSGSSGGPVLNDHGRVIGVTVSQFSDAQNLNFAAPISFVQALMEAPPEIDISPSMLPSASPFADTLRLIPVSDAAPRPRVVLTPFEGDETRRSLAGMIASDLLRSGYFEVLRVDEREAADYVLTGTVEQGTMDVPWRLRFSLESTKLKTIILSGDYPVSEEANLAEAAHKASDAVLLGLAEAPSPILDAVILASASEEGGAPDTLILSEWDGFTVSILAQNDDGIVSPVMSPDQKSVAYVAGEPGVLVRHSLESGKEVELATGLNTHSSIAWSPDGRWIAASFSEDDKDRLYRVHARSGVKRVVTDESFSERNPTFSPDGQRLVMTSTRSGHPQLYEVTLKDRAIRALTRGNDANGQGQYSPDGKHLVHTTVDGEETRVQILNLISLESTPYAYGSRPTWVADGSLILFEPMDSYGVTPALALMNLSTGHLAPLRVRGHSGLSMPDWIDSP